MGCLTFGAQRQQWRGPPWHPEKLCLQLLGPVPDAAHHPTDTDIIISISILNAEWYCHACLAGRLLDVASADPCCICVHCAAARRRATEKPQRIDFVEIQLVDTVAETAQGLCRASTQWQHQGSCMQPLACCQCTCFAS
jgi:hypothetical protein